MVLGEEFGEGGGGLQPWIWRLVSDGNDGEDKNSEDEERKADIANHFDKVLPNGLSQIGVFFHWGGSEKP